MRRVPSGFTLIELMIVISIIGVLAAVLLPRLLETQSAANASADALQMRTHFTWLTDYQRRHDNFMPTEGGYKFVLSTWTSKQFDHTPENLDKYFTPGNKDPYWKEVRLRMAKGEDPWPDLNSTTPEDTHYVGRAKKEIRSARGATEALMANDNEGIWNHDDGTINVLFADGNVRTYSYQMLRETFAVGDLDKANPIVTYGPNSPIEPCRKLDN